MDIEKIIQFFFGGAEATDLTLGGVLLANWALIAFYILSLILVIVGLYGLGSKIFGSKEAFKAIIPFAGLWKLFYRIDLNPYFSIACWIPVFGIPVRMLFRFKVARAFGEKNIALCILSMLLPQVFLIYYGWGSRSYQLIKGKNVAFANAFHTEMPGETGTAEASQISQSANQYIETIEEARREAEAERKAAEEARKKAEEAARLKRQAEIDANAVFASKQVGSDGPVTTIRLPISADGSFMQVDQAAQARAAMEERKRREAAEAEAKKRAEEEAKKKAAEEAAANAKNQAEKERLEREAAERAAREQAEREAREKAEREEALRRAGDAASAELARRRMWQEQQEREAAEKAQALKDQQDALAARMKRIEEALGRARQEELDRIAREQEPITVVTPATKATAEPDSEEIENLEDVAGYNSLPGAIRATAFGDRPAEADSNYRDAYYNAEMIVAKAAKEEYEATGKAPAGINISIIAPDMDEVTKGDAAAAAKKTAEASAEAGIPGSAAPAAPSDNISNQPIDIKFDAGVVQPTGQPDIQVIGRQNLESPSQAAATIEQQTEELAERLASLQSNNEAHMPAPQTTPSAQAAPAPAPTMAPAAAPAAPTQPAQVPPVQAAQPVAGQPVMTLENPNDNLGQHNDQWVQSTNNFADPDLNK